MCGRIEQNDIVDHRFEDTFNSKVARIWLGNLVSENEEKMVTKAKMQEEEYKKRIKDVLKMIFTMSLEVGANIW